MKAFNRMIKIVKSWFEIKEKQKQFRFPFLFYFASDRHIRACLPASGATEVFMCDMAATTFVRALPSLKAWPEQNFAKFIEMMGATSRSPQYSAREIDDLESRLLGWRVTLGLPESRLIFWSTVYNYLYTQEGRKAMKTNELTTGDIEQNRSAMTKRAHTLYEATQEAVRSANMYLHEGFSKEAKTFLIYTTGTAAGEMFETFELSKPLKPAVDVSEIPIPGICFMTLDHCSKLIY